jgi:hypothetical protein
MCVASPPSSSGSGPAAQGTPTTLATPASGAPSATFNYNHPVYTPENYQYHINKTEYDDPYTGTARTGGTYKPSNPGAAPQLVRVQSTNDGGFKYTYRSASGQTFHRYTPIGHATGPTGAGEAATRVYAPGAQRTKTGSDLTGLRIDAAAPTTPNRSLRI